MTVDASDEDIFAAADAILASGLPATPARVCAHMGYGNPLQIGARLDHWWAQRLKRLRSDALPAPVHQALALLWQQATAQGRTDAEAAFARQRQAGVEYPRAMEHAFVTPDRALERKVAKERQVFAEQRQRLLDCNEQLRDRLRQAREAAKGAKIAAQLAAKNLRQAQRALGHAQLIAARRNWHDHEREVKLRAVSLELLSRPVAAAQAPDVNGSGDGTGANLWRDFMPLLDAAQGMLGPRLEALQQQLSAAPGTAPGLSHSQLDGCLGQAQVIEQLLVELRQQAEVYRTVVDALFLQWAPLALKARQLSGCGDVCVVEAVPLGQPAACP